VNTSAAVGVDSYGYWDEYVAVWLANRRDPDGTTRPLDDTGGSTMSHTMCCELPPDRAEIVRKVVQADVLGAIGYGSRAAWFALTGMGGAGLFLPQTGMAIATSAIGGAIFGSGVAAIGTVLFTNGGLGGSGSGGGATDACPRGFYLSMTGVCRIVSLK
jgi:hypothetical protein